MIENRNVNIITDADGKKLVLINDIRFKGKRQINWDYVKQYLEGYVGDYYEIEENAERIYIGSELPEEYTESESRKSLMGANAKAKANAATAVPELIQIASNPAFEENRKEKHNKNKTFYFLYPFPADPTDNPPTILILFLYARVLNCKKSSFFNKKQLNKMRRYNAVFIGCFCLSYHNI